MLRWIEALEDGLFQKSRTLSPPWGPILRQIRYPVAIIRDWITGEINVQAMSLAYTTLLSLAPLLVFIFSVLKGLGARDDLRIVVFEFFRPMGSEAAQLTGNVMQYADNLRGGIAGSIGLALLMYSVTTTVQKIEASFNFVWRVLTPRSFARRFSGYLSVMIGGPALIAAILGLLSSVQQGPVARWAGTLAPAMPYALVTLVFAFMYSLIPNTRVKPFAAMVGAIAAGITWALVSQLFAAFILYSSQMLAVYTGFAVVLTALIWIYLNWLILLLGAQLAFYVQYPQYLRHGQESVELTGSAREQAALSVAILLARNDRGKKFWTSNTLASALDVPSTALAPVLGCLERAGLLAATPKEYFVLGRAAADIYLFEILDAVRLQQPGRLLVTVHAEVSATNTIGEIESAMRQRLGQRTLEDLAAGNSHQVE